MHVDWGVMSCDLLGCCLAIGWWLVSKGNMIGWVPSTYLESNNATQEKSEKGHVHQYIPACLCTPIIAHHTFTHMAHQYSLCIPIIAHHTFTHMAHQYVPACLCTPIIAHHTFTHMAHQYIPVCALLHYTICTFTHMVQYFIHACLHTMAQILQ